MMPIKALQWVGQWEEELLFKTKGGTITLRNHSLRVVFLERD